MCFEPTNIQCILIDDGLGTTDDAAKLYDYRSHDRLTHSPTRRIVRVEAIAEVIPFDVSPCSLEPYSP